LYFPQESYVPILQGLLRAASHRYTSKEIYEPFAVGVLADLATATEGRSAAVRPASDLSFSIAAIGRTGEARKSDW
jgi:hypothetical protein